MNLVGARHILRGQCVASFPDRSTWCLHPRVLEPRVGVVDAFHIRDNLGLDVFHYFAEAFRARKVSQRDGETAAPARPRRSQSQGSNVSVCICVRMLVMVPRTQRLRESVQQRRVETWDSDFFLRGA